MDTILTSPPSPCFLVLDDDVAPGGEFSALGERLHHDHRHRPLAHEPAPPAAGLVLVGSPARALAWLEAQAARPAEPAPSAPAGATPTAWPTCPLTLIGPPPSTQQAAALLGAGLSGWWPASLIDDATGWQAALELDRARWLQQRQLVERAGRLQEELQDRKWVERAKGVLMQARGVGEPEAFSLLRGAAMHASLRLGEVSRAVAEAAQWAEALNRAGQLRMGSQRLVLLAATACESRGLRGVQARRGDAQARLDELFRQLRAMATAGHRQATWLGLLAETEAAHRALLQALPERVKPALLAEADSRAERMLERAEALLDTLEASSGRRALRIVSVCGRQRMRVQRLAKQALLAHWLGDATRRDGLPALLDEYETATRELETAPLSSPEIRQTLRRSSDEWLNLVRSLTQLDTYEGREALVLASDTLLAHFDQLTAAYEHSLQVIMA